MSPGILLYRLRQAGFPGIKGRCYHGHVLTVGGCGLCLRDARKAGETMSQGMHYLCGGCLKERFWPHAAAALGPCECGSTLLVSGRPIPDEDLRRAAELARREGWVNVKP